RSQKGSFLCEAWYQMSIEYWKKEIKKLDYYQIHLMFKALVEKNLIAKDLFAKMPHIPEDEISLFIGENILEKFDANEWEKIRTTSFFQKTTYRVRYRDDYSGTYFSKLCKGEI
ncbi:MAG: capsular polysaccharide synthesis protein, partial [Paludibacter sp.]|nr:capsular polysaccharide synthesis protein [Paludibacter sp.]